MNCQKILLSLLAILVVATTFAQPICGFDAIYHKNLEDPAYRKKVEISDANIRKYIQSHKSQLEARVAAGTAALYTIPVVVHVVHTGGALGSVYNPTDAQITGAINYLNQVYDGTYPGIQGVGDMQIKFALAQRDPNCNPTTGINHIDGSGISGYTAAGINYSTSGGSPQINVKNLIRWPVADYYNIWIVNKIDGNDGTSGQFVAGFAYFAVAAPASLDGTVMLATQMVAGQKTLPHEIGHAFGLYHTFEGSVNSVSCPANTDCTTNGDKVCDTDPVSNNLTAGVYDFTCRTGTNSCAGGAPFSINTESNFMAYTNCYTLFTAGQKARALATLAGEPNRVSLTNSLGATPTTSGCAPKINFETAEGQASETTTATADCRPYKDYTYNMVIGNDPTQPATATLSVAGGNATETVDFAITTNGNFSTPSKILSFPSGAHAAKSFTIRIYDDAIVESNETFTLGFTVNNGGGNAVKGEGITALTFTISDNDAAPFGPANITKSVGASVGSVASPFRGSSAKEKTQIIYKAAELTAAGLKAGNFTGLSFNLIKNSGAAFVYTGLTIKLGQTTNGSLYNASTEFPLSDAGFTTVYSQNYTTVNGINSFTFSTPFTWDGVSNVVVEVCYDNGATTSADDNCLAYSDGATTASYVYSAINCSTTYISIGYLTNGFKPIIQFVYPDPGTQVQTVLNTSRQEYLGPNADVYFYDQATGKLMARIANGSSFDYGCTQVVIDRNITSAGANAVAFWNNNTANYLMSKTLRVIPTTNNPSGNYQISLYYTQAEINGWQTATGQNISSAQLVKVTNQITNVTPAAPGAGGVVTLSTPVITTLGTNTVLTASFSNGFSGFGAGVAGLALPVHLLDFKAKLVSNAVVLDWSTSSEINSYYFDVERSYDGINFTKAGTVNAAGNSSLSLQYSFNDPSVAQENNFYRLKQVDKDGKWEYSKVVSIRYQGKTNSFRVINNPFTDKIDIEFGKLPTGNLLIKLLDVTGKEVYRTTVAATDQTRVRVNTAGKNMSAGIYVLQVTTNQQQFVERIMKE